jgi:hypothetical protein
MYAAFPIVIFFIGAGVLVGLPLVSTLQTYLKNRGRRPVVCPDDHTRAGVEVDRKFTLHAAMHGKEQMRVKTCSHWPENGNCGQECLVQVEATPENIDRLLTRWFDGKPCNVCRRPLTPADWRFGRVGFLNEQSKLVELQQIDLDNFGTVAEPTRPLCWTCHQQEKQRQAQPVHIGVQNRQTAGA